MSLFFRLGVLSVLFASVTGSASAASLYLDPPRSEIGPGDAVELAVRLDVDESSGECINAVDGVLKYSDSIEPVDTSLGGSIFTIWVEEPVISSDKKTISFAGGMPNGYCGRVDGDPRLTNTIAKLIFRAPSTVTELTTADVVFLPQTKAYANDGFGTQITPQTFAAAVTINPELTDGIDDPWRTSVQADTIPPEEFSIILERGSGVFAGNYYISFNTTDKQTGIDSYQVIEEPIADSGAFSWGRADAPWVTTRSPYELSDQSLNSIIRVKAIDKAGNEYIASLLPDESLRTNVFSKTVAVVGVYVIIFLIVLGCIAVVIAFVREHRAETSPKSLIKKVNIPDVGQRAENREQDTETKEETESYSSSQNK